MINNGQKILPEDHIKKVTCFRCDTQLIAPFIKIPNSIGNYKEYCTECARIIIGLLQQQKKAITTVPKEVYYYRYTYLEENIDYILGNIKKVNKNVD